jgi:thioredoxin-like negative regulator of GroEL
MAILRGAISIALMLTSALAHAEEVRQGDPLPRLALTDHNGANVQIRGDAAPVVIVEFWASWCLACRKTLPAIAALAAEQPNRIHLFAVGIDRDDEKAAEFVRDYLPTAREGVTVLRDPEASAMARFGPQGMPAVYAAESGIVHLTIAGARPETEELVRQFVARSNPDVLIGSRPSR